MSSPPPPPPVEPAPALTVLLLYTVTPAWLSLSREERRQVEQATLRPLLSRWAPGVRARLYDAEAFTARCSDFAVLEASDLLQFSFFYEALRDTALFTVPYLVVNDLIVGLENGFRHYERQDGLE
ncbi:darcynin family protein [Deinococcus koreensis]|uniref:Darcynin 1 n=1 Tax=Deinococcus koreensis TaxID=2054903 RepID=A0A2K3UY71_9DEIO|nr:darcynin family protein [Deinococcus koreensis]PNY81492.1 hypothetical protein CVO96_08950 [Deinococcus koreensis]